MAVKSGNKQFKNKYFLDIKMNKFNILWQSNKKKIPSQLQVKEKELFIEIDNKIIKIPFTSIVNSTLKENTLSIETDENTYQLESEHAKLIKEKIKDYHKEKNKISKKKSKEEILQDILALYNKFIENKPNEMLFAFSDETSSTLINYALETDETESIISVVKSKVWEFFLGLYYYILENVDNSSNTEEFFRNLFPDVIDEFHDILKSNDEEILKDYQYEENLKRVNTFFLKNEQALEIKPELRKGVPDYQKFKSFLKELEQAYNDYVNPSKKLNIFLNIVKEPKKIDPNSQEGILKLVNKRFMRFHVSKYAQIFTFASPKYHESLSVGLKTENDELIESSMELAEKQFYMSLFLYCYQKIDQSEKTKEFFRNIYPNLVDSVLEMSEEDLKILDYNHYEQIISDIISLTMRMKKQREENQTQKDFDCESYQMYDEIEPYLLFLEESYNRYVKPEKELNILLNHQVNRGNNQGEASSKAWTHFYLPIVLIIAMVILFFMELFGDGGIIIDCGWFSVGLFIILVIWAAVGANEKECTCPTCGKWDALKLQSDRIIDSKDTWRTKTEYINNRRIEKQVAVRIDLHEQHYICENCNNETVKYVNEETIL